MIVITDLEAHVCSPESPVRDVLERLARCPPHLVQVVVDDSGRLLGTVTDGDIRRAMLRDIGLDAPARMAMHTTPVVGRMDDGDANYEKARRMGSSHAFLPVVDGNGVLREIHVDGRAGNTPIARAVVMAGGFGTRLGGRTRNTPKSLLPVGGQPILEHIIARLEDAGVANIHVAVHYLADQIESFVARRHNRAEIHMVQEEAPLGTAGALGRMAKLSEGPVLVVNGDVITSVDVAALRDFHVRHGHDATVGVAQYAVDVPFGVVRYGEDGMFDGIEEKPRFANFIAAGVYYLAPRFLALVPDDRPMDMPELLKRGREVGLRIGLFPIHEYWTDLGQPDDFDAADDFLTHGRAVAKR